jgi:hypothetical protein
MCSPRSFEVEARVPARKEEGLVELRTKSAVYLVNTR